jgi:hypothetical protein
VILPKYGSAIAVRPSRILARVHSRADQPVPYSVCCLRIRAVRACLSPLNYVQTPMSTPPPFPSATPPQPPSLQAASGPSQRGWRRIPVWGWALIVLVVGGFIAAAVVGTLVVGRFVGEGWDMFEKDARIALQRNPTIQERIGTIREIKLNLTGTGNSVHPNDFVFHVEGDRGEGSVRARFESELDGESIRQGVLTMEDGSEWPLVPDPDP